MSSSIYNDHTAWHVSNMMFARVLEFAGDVGAELASTHREREWVRHLATRVSSFGTYVIRAMTTSRAQVEARN